MPGVLDYLDGDQLLPALWCEENTLLKGRPWAFAGTRAEECRPFLVQPMNDKSDLKTYYKPRQGGFSEISVRETLWFLNVFHYTNAAYTFHRPKNLEDFSKARIDAVLRDSPHLKGTRIVKGADNVTFKAVGSGFLYLRARTSEAIAEGIDIDLLVNDEADRGNQKAPESFAEAMSASRFKWRRDFGTPTVPGWGVHKFWERSDKKKWHNYCTACGDANFLTLDHIVQVSDKPLGEGRHGFRCESCKAVGKIDRTDGMWWPEIEDRQCDYSGYHMNQLAYPWMTADDILVKKRDAPFPALFANYVLGIAYAGENRLVTQAQLDACREAGFKAAVPPAGIRRFRGVSIGVDWGDTSWAVAFMRWHDRILLLDLFQTTTDDGDEQVEQIADWARPYHPQVMVCDAGYGKDRNKRLLQKFKNRVYSCFYSEGRRTTEDEWIEKRMRVTVDRARSLKIMAWAFRGQSMMIPVFEDAKGETLRMFKQHLLNLVSSQERDEETYEIREQILTMGPDHFAHAANYAYIGLIRMPGATEFF